MSKVYKFAKNVLVMQKLSYLTQSHPSEKWKTELSATWQQHINSAYPISSHLTIFLTKKTRNKCNWNIIQQTIIRNKRKKKKIMRNTHRMKPSFRAVREHWVFVREHWKQNKTKQKNVQRMQNPKCLICQSAYIHFKVKIVFESHKFIGIPQAFDMMHDNKLAIKINE